MHTSQQLLAFIKACFRHFVAINGTLKAAALAYATLVSIVPVMLLSLGFILAFPSLSDNFQSLRGYIFRHFVPASAHNIEAHLGEFAHNATNLSATGTLFFLVTSVILIFTMEAAFNAVWNIKTRRRGLKAFFMYWVVLTLIPPLGVLAIALSVYLATVPYLSAMIEMISYIAPFMLTFCGFILLYLAVPNCMVRLRHAALGAAVAALLFEITKFGFSIYITYFSNETIVYGVLSAIPVFLLWLYLSWLITIIGAVVAHQVGMNSKALASAFANRRGK